MFYFVSLYFTIVKGFGSDEAGTNLLYYLPGLGGNLIRLLSIADISANIQQVVLI